MIQLLYIPHKDKVLNMVNLKDDIIFCESWMWIAACVFCQKTGLTVVILGTEHKYMYMWVGECIYVEIMNEKGASFLSYECWNLYLNVYALCV